MYFKINKFELLMDETILRQMVYNEYGRVACRRRLSNL